MSQNLAILKHLQTGNSITPLEALHLFGCFRLSARIHDLINIYNHDIKCELVVNNKKRFAKYSLIL
jgi:hypothetical protein